MPTGNKQAGRTISMNAEQVTRTRQEWTQDNKEFPRHKTVPPFHGEGIGTQAFEITQTMPTLPWRRYRDTGI